MYVDDSDVVHYISKNDERRIGLCNLFAFAYRLFRRDFSPLDGTYCMGTHSFLQPYIHFVLIWEGFMNGQSWSLLLQFSVLIS